MSEYNLISAARQCGVIESSPADEMAWALDAIKSAEKMNGLKELNQFLLSNGYYLTTVAHTITRAQWREQQETSGQQDNFGYDE